MTSLQRFSKLSHDELFEKHSISEIKAFQNDLQKEVGKKQDEIRILVGEKYRDFIEVADRIDFMNKLSENITNHIGNISSALSSLNLNLDDELLKSKQFARKALSEDNTTKNTVAILIKLLINIEDQIWDEIENNQFITATNLLQLAVHIKTNLSLEASWHVDKRFPVVHELWHSILRFPVILTKMIEEKIKTHNFSVTETCECLYTLTTLENLNCVDVIKRFLNLRTESLRSILNVENVTQNVKTNIIASLQMINNTFEVLYDCFKTSENENQNGEYWIQMRNKTAPLCIPALDLVNLDYTTKFGKIYIPTAIQNFRIKCSKPVIIMESFSYNQFFDEWLVWIREYVKPHVAILLNIVGSLKNLQLLKESIPPLPEDWALIMKHFNQPENLNLWAEIYQPLITERAKAILFDQWNNVYRKIESELEIIQNEILNDHSNEPENDLHWFLWDSFTDDLTEKMNPDSSLNSKSLMIKSAGLSPNSGRMCIFIETLISNMMKQLSDICSDFESETEETQILKKHQQQCCLQLIEKLIACIMKHSAEENVTENVIIFLARVLFGISSVCNSLKQCVLLLDDKGDKWLYITSKLLDESLKVWKKWSFNVTSVIFSEYDLHLTSPFLSSHRIRYFPKWEAIKIKEENEQGQEIESEVMVPFQASFPLQKLLNSLNSVSCGTLPPRVIVAEIIENTIGRIISSFERLDKQVSNQAVFIQYLFDIKYLTNLLIPIERDDLIVLSNNIIGKLESKIDPVDLDALSSHLTQNVDQHVFKTQGMYGILINNKPKMSMEQYSDNSENPNVSYIGAVNVPWFPLLPSAVFQSK